MLGFLATGAFLPSISRLKCGCEPLCSPFGNAGGGMSERVFDGLKVIDCASFIAGPAAATVMSDFGAEVVKIEPPGVGDPYRRRATPPVGPGLAGNPGFVLDGRNKKSLALDLREAEGRAVLYRLVAAADVFITNYPPPVRRRLGITYDDLAPLNPRLVYASFTGYGETGPEADKPGFDATAWWARSGLMHLVRAGEEASPARSLPGMGDHPSAMGTYGAIVTALYQRERTGKGAYVGSSLLANGLWANGCSVQAALSGEKVVPQPPRERGLNALRIHYRCRDHRWILLSIAADEWRFDRFKACLASPALDDPRFATHALREQNAGALIAVLDGIFASHDQADWRRRLDEAGLIFGIVADMDEVACDEQMLASGALVPFTDGSGLTVDSPLWIAGQQKLPPCPAPAVGQHSDEILSRLGYLSAEIAALREAGVIG
jgi:crotonobetainyl-CoA:carnitine CoA-transferase CaiB-like acyl-CoA transferase